MRSERIRKLRITYDKDFQIKSAKDFSNRCKWNNYEYGREVVNILEDILNKDFEVLEIGAGPGTLTIPLSGKVRKITCVEASKTNWVCVFYGESYIDPSQMFLFYGVFRIDFPQKKALCYDSLLAPSP